MSLSLPPRPEFSPVAFYVHHHGSGHATRCKQIAACWPDDSPIHIFTSAPEYFAGWSDGTVHTLPPDVEDGRDPGRDMLDNQVLHYAPTDLRDLSRRMALISGWIAKNDPKVFVVDLSCEMALFIRLCGVKVALVRLHGFRRDPAHVAAFQLADQLLAPFPPCLEDAHTEAWIREKTIYLGLFSRYDHREESAADCRDHLSRILNLDTDRSIVTVANGSGGDTRKISYWEEVARINPDRHFLLLGRLDRDESEVENLTVVGYVNDTYPYLKAADVIIGSGGTNTMSEVAAVSGRYLSLPEERPHTEQLCKMRALERYGLTRAIRPGIPPEEWEKWLRRAGDLQPARWKKVRYSGNFAAAVHRLARRYSGEGIAAPVRIDGLGGRQLN